MPSSQRRRNCAVRSPCPSSPHSCSILVSPTAAVYFAYTALIFGLSHYSVRLPARSLLVATAVLDPLLISSWLMFTNEYGGLVCGFYLFNILGFGFRAGRRLMHLCQLSAIVGFVAVLFVSVMWSSLCG